MNINTPEPRQRRQSFEERVAAELGLARERATLDAVERAAATVQGLRRTRGEQTSA